MRFLKTSTICIAALPLAMATGLAGAADTSDAQRLEILGIKPATTAEAVPDTAATSESASAPTPASPPPTTETETTPAAGEHEAAAEKEGDEKTEATRAAPDTDHHETGTTAPAVHHEPAASDSGHDAEHPVAEKEESHHGEIHWGYEGAGAPHYWGDLKAEFATCKTGRSQSPIDISAVVVTQLPAIQIDYGDTPLDIVNNGHTIKVNYQSGSSITVDGKRFHLLQFHFHSPSEHTIGGKAYPMVAHLVHKADDGQLGVIGVMIKEGRSNALLEQLWAHLPETAGSSVTVESEQINVSGLLPADLTYFNYSGSLTTPPCTEGVHWMVLAAPTEASAEQIARFRALYPNDARPVQPVNGRTIRLSN